MISQHNSMPQQTSQKEFLSSIRQFLHLNPFKIKVMIYLSIYIAGLAYSVYALYLKLRDLKNSTFQEDLVDLEWESFIYLVENFGFYSFISLFLGQVIRRFIPQAIRLFYAVFSTVMMKIMFGFGATLFCYIIPLIMFIALIPRSKTLVWTTWILLLFLCNKEILHSFIKEILLQNSINRYNISVVTSWSLLRSFSFCRNVLEQDPQRRMSSTFLFIDLLSYNFYFPLLVLGPYLPNKDYTEGIEKKFEFWSISKLVWFMLQLLRFGFWLLVLDIFWQPIQGWTLSITPKDLKLFDSWETSGFLIISISFFILKYFVMYGFTSFLTRAEQYNAPEPPKCFFILYRFSEVWRHFDVGLYLFIKNELYIPFKSISTGIPPVLKELLGNAFVFFFVCAWHGFSPSVQLWCFLNFVLTLTEKWFHRLHRSSVFAKLEIKYLGGLPRGILRRVVRGLFGSLCYFITLIFVTSHEHASQISHNIFVKGFPVATFITIFFFSLTIEGGYDFRASKNMKCKTK
ncbi:UNVERIFIED_CONTAM: hypothetical protein RMT77_016885 [Armadillidium vulgare]